MDRIKRLQALQAQKTSSSASGSGRKRVPARVLHLNNPEEAHNEEKMRARMKELALKKQKDEELRQQEERDVQISLQEVSVQEEDIYSESSTEDEEVMLKPVFVPKAARQTVVDEEDEDESQRLQEHRHREAHALLAEYVRMEVVDSRTKPTDAEFEAFAGTPKDPRSIDDTDDLDEEAEFQAWKLRELLRVKGDREAREAREREEIELERLRNLTEEEKQQIDREKQAEWEDKPKGEYRFLQKYYHKGAFFGDFDDEVVKRDYSAPTGEDHARREFLPEALQVKNFGKRGRTKWTHLTAEDTTEFTTGWGQKANQANYRLVGRMAGMRGDPSAKRGKP